MPPKYDNLLLISLLILATIPLILKSQNITDNLTFNYYDNLTSSQAQFSSFLIEINDTIDVDYMMDDSTSSLWQYVNSSLENLEFFSVEPTIGEYRNVTATTSRAIVRISTKPKQLIDELHWPIKYESVVEGDVILGGLMMVHEREDNATCGPIMPQGGIQALEAMLFTLDRINEMKLLGPDVKIGAHILDDCDKDTYGLEMAVDFIKGE